MDEMSALLFANNQKIHVDGWVLTFSRLFPLIVCAWSAERSIATSCLPRWMLISCVGAIMFRITTVLNAASRVPQYRGFGTNVSCVPSAKWTFLRKRKTNVFASLDADHDCTSSGRGWARSPPLYVKNVS